jgi:hypothetical protein
MPDAVSFKVLNLQEFQDTLNKYVLYNKREFPRIIATKAYRIAIVACHETYRPPKGSVAKALSMTIEDFQRTKSGRTKRVMLKSTSTAGGVFNTVGVPIGALLVNWRRGKRGMKGLYGADMKAAVRRLEMMGERARAYLASGWIPAIKKLAPLADRGRFAGQNVGSPDPEARKIENPKGRASISSSSGSISAATIVNEAVAKVTTTPDPLGKYGLPALQKAVDVETASMLQYIEDKMREGANQLRIKNN